MAVGAARPGLADGLVAVGAVLSVYGVGLLSVPGAFILAGVLLAAMGVLAAYRHG